MHINWGISKHTIIYQTTYYQISQPNQYACRKATQDTEYREAKKSKFREATSIAIVTKRQGQRKGCDLNKTDRDHLKKLKPMND